MTSENEKLKQVIKNGLLVGKIGSVICGVATIVCCFFLGKMIHDKYSDFADIVMVNCQKSHLSNNETFWINYDDSPCCYWVASVNVTCVFADGYHNVEWQLNQWDASDDRFRSKEQIDALLRQTFRSNQTYQCAMSPYDPNFVMTTKDDLRSRIEYRRNYLGLTLALVFLLLLTVGLFVLFICTWIEERHRWRIHSQPLLMMGPSYQLAMGLHPRLGSNSAVRLCRTQSNASVDPLCIVLEFVGQE